MRFIQFIQSNKWNQATVRRVRRAQFYDESQSRLFARTRDCLPYCTRDELPRVVSSPLHWAIQTTEPCCFAKKLAGKSECERRKAPERRRLDLTKRRSARYIYIYVCIFLGGRCAERKAREIRNSFRTRGCLTRLIVALSILAAFPLTLFLHELSLSLHRWWRGGGATYMSAGAVNGLPFSIKRHRAADTDRAGRARSQAARKVFSWGEAWCRRWRQSARVERRSERGSERKARERKGAQRKLRG